MAQEFLLYEAVFTIFAGFLVFISIILNRIQKFFEVLDTYFVLFLFTGILMSFIGIFLMFMWNFRNRGPYDGAITREDHPFVTYFTIGILFIFFSLTGIYFFNSIGVLTYIFRILSISGILILSTGLFFFAKELINIVRTTGKHSGT